MKQKINTRLLVKLIIGSIVSVLVVGCQSQESAHESSRAHRPTRMLEPGTALTRTYYQALRSIQGCETFIGQYPDERDLCAGAQLQIARLHTKQDQKGRAIEAYQRAIDEYGEEIVPDVNATFRVKDWALYRIGLLYKDMGQRDKAMQIFESLTSDAKDSNTKRSARVKYLEAKQSHLKLGATVSVPKKTYALGDNIPVSVVVRNHTQESVIFRCFARIMRKRHKSYGAIAPRTEQDEITLAPALEYRESFTFFTERDGLEPGEWEIDCNLGGISVTTNSVLIRVVDSE